MKYLIIVLLLFTVSCKSAKKDKKETYTHTVKEIEINKDFSSIISENYFSEKTISNIEIHTFQAIDSSGVTVIKPLVYKKSNQNKIKKTESNTNVSEKINEESFVEEVDSNKELQTERKSFNILGTVLDVLFTHLTKFILAFLFIVIIFLVILYFKNKNKKKL